MNKFIENNAYEYHIHDDVHDDVHDDDDDDDDDVHDDDDDFTHNKIIPIYTYIV